MMDYESIDCGAREVGTSTLIDDDAHRTTEEETLGVVVVVVVVRTQFVPPRSCG